MSKEELGPLYCFFCGRKLTDKSVEINEDECAEWDIYEVECPTCHRQYSVEI